MRNAECKIKGKGMKGRGKLKIKNAKCRIRDEGAVLCARVNNKKGGAYIIRKVDPVNWHGINGIHLKNKERSGKRGSNP